jgi:hypothetical protein
MIQTRCARAFVCEIEEVTELSFNRTLNDISEASFTATVGCCDCLATVNPWQHEVAFYRNDEQVWVGPISEMEFNPSDETITVTARDLLAWADRRLVELADIPYEAASTDLSDAYVWLLEHAYCKDPWCMSFSMDPTGIPVTDRYYPAFDKAGGERWGGGYVTCGEEMRTLSQSGVDYTVVNRHLWGGNVQVVNPVGSGVVLLDKHFKTPPTVKVTGAKMGTRFVSAGGQGGYDGYYDEQIAIYPTTTGPIGPTLLTANQRQYGLLEILNTTNILDDVDTTINPNPIAQDAKSRWDLLHVPYAYISEGALSYDAPVIFNEDLIPGGIVKVLLEDGCRRLSDTSVRIKSVSVALSGAEETVTLSLSPVGTTEIV